VLTPGRTRCRRHGDTGFDHQPTRTTTSAVFVRAPSYPQRSKIHASFQGGGSAGGQYGRRYWPSHAPRPKARAARRAPRPRSWRVPRAGSGPSCGQAWPRRAEPSSKGKRKRDNDFYFIPPGMSRLKARCRIARARDLPLTPKFWGPGGSDGPVLCSAVGVSESVNVSLVDHAHVFKSHGGLLARP
jgi:hypothetical protein